MIRWTPEYKISNLLKYSKRDLDAKEARLQAKIDEDETIDAPRMRQLIRYITFAKEIKQNRENTFS